MFPRSKQIGVSVHCIALKMLVNVEVRKLEIFALKCTFLGQNRLQTPIELRVALIAMAHRVTYIEGLWQ